MPFDVIVIGAGSAGCVIASRLSEDPSRSVLLLEAGGPDKAKEVHIPAAFSKLFKTEVDWAYHTAPQEHAGGREMYWPRGKMLGGSSSLNAMIYQRGHPACYDHWAELGNEGWNWSQVLPLFRRSEHQERGASRFHGEGGPLVVADLRSPSVISMAFVDACDELGLGRNEDFNDGTQEGFGLYQATQRRGKRCSTAQGFLRPARRRRNLTVETHALATKLLFDGTRCVGVAYEQGGAAREATLTDDGEVVVSGGTVNSPQILMLSGIGDPEHLSELDIPVVNALPGVGRNLLDHPAVGLLYTCTGTNTLESAETLGSLLKFLILRRGMLTSTVAESGGFMTLLDDSPWPDLQYHFAPGFFIEHGFEQPEGYGISIGPTLVYPKSVGWLKLSSDDPHEHPVIQPNYFDHEDDLHILVEGLKLGRRMAETQALSPWVADEYLPGADVDSDEALADFVLEKFETLYHPVGTCKMGTDDEAVVDSQLRVHGIEGLRVADASIMPTIVNANTNAPSIMIGEKAAELVAKA